MKTTCNKAPVGGMASVVNGNWYEGGEFMPITGEFCGRGRNRIAVAKLVAVNSSAVDMRIAWSEKYGRFQLIRKSDDYIVCSASNLRTLEKFLQ